MKTIIKYYPLAWFKVEYKVYDTYIEFKAWRISAIDEDNVENSDLERSPCIEGCIDYDGCMDFKQGDHYCGIHHAEQMMILMNEIFKFHSEER